MIWKEACRGFHQGFRSCFFKLCWEDAFPASETSVSAWTVVSPCLRRRFHSSAGEPLQRSSRSLPAVARIRSSTARWMNGSEWQIYSSIDEGNKSTRVGPMDGVWTSQIKAQCRQEEKKKSKLRAAVEYSRSIAVESVLYSTPYGAVSGSSTARVN